MLCVSLLVLLSVRVWVCVRKCERVHTYVHEKQRHTRRTKQQCRYIRGKQRQMKRCERARRTAERVRGRGWVERHGDHGDHLEPNKPHHSNSEGDSHCG